MKPKDLRTNPLPHKKSHIVRAKVTNDKRININTGKLTGKMHTYNNRHTCSKLVGFEKIKTSLGKLSRIKIRSNNECKKE